MKRDDDDDDDECAPIFGEILQHLDDRDRPEPVVDEISSWRTDGLYACLVSGVLSRVECEALVAATERRGYVPALLNKGRGREVLEPSFRRGDRRIVDDPRLARLIFDRVRPFVEPSRGRWRLVGANERLRFLKYAAGDFFKLHGDGSYVRGAGPRRGETSFVTLLVYALDAQRLPVLAVPVAAEHGRRQQVARVVARRRRRRLRRRARRRQPHDG